MPDSSCTSTSHSSPLLILAAQRFEAQYLLDLLETHIQAQRQERDKVYRFCELGIGPIAAAKTAALLPKASRVVYVGSCGEFAKEYHPRLMTSQQVYWSPASVRSDQSALVENITPPISLKLSEVSQKLEKCICFTSPSITLDPCLRPKELALYKGGKEKKNEISGVENLELYAVSEYLKECEDVTVVLAVTNVVGKDGRRQWRENHQLAAMITAEFLYDHREYWLQEPCGTTGEGIG